MQYELLKLQTANLAQETYIYNTVTSSHSQNEPSRLQKSDPDTFPLTSHDMQHDTRIRALAESFSIFCPFPETEHPPIVTTCRLEHNL